MQILKMLKHGSFKTAPQNVTVKVQHHLNTIPKEEPTVLFLSNADFVEPTPLLSADIYCGNLETNVA